MSQVLTVPTYFNDIGELSQGFLDRVERDTLILYGPVAYPEGSRIEFALILADGTPAIEGAGRVRAAVDGGEDRVPETRYDVVVDSLELEGRYEVVFERLVLARQAVSDPPPDGADADSDGDGEQTAFDDAESRSSEAEFLEDAEVTDQTEPDAGGPTPGEDPVVSLSPEDAEPDTVPPEASHDDDDEDEEDDAPTVIASVDAYAMMADADPNLDGVGPGLAATDFEADIETDPGSEPEVDATDPETSATMAAGTEHEAEEVEGDDEDSDDADFALSDSDLEDAIADARVAGFHEALEDATDTDYEMVPDEALEDATDVDYEMVSDEVLTDATGPAHAQVDDDQDDDASDGAAVSETGVATAAQWESDSDPAVEAEGSSDSEGAFEHGVAQEPMVGMPVPVPSMAAPPESPPAPPTLRLAEPPEGLTRPSLAGPEDTSFSVEGEVSDVHTTGLFAYEGALPIPSRPPLPDPNRLERAAIVEVGDGHDVEDDDAPEMLADEYEEVRLSDFAETAEEG